MKIALDETSATPPYEQVRATIAHQINKNILPVGTKLPTVRTLAEQLGIAPNTVARAYRELEEAGLIDTRGRAGSFVSATGNANKRRAQQAAAEYAAVIHQLGLSETEGRVIVTTALAQTFAPG